MISRDLSQNKYFRKNLPKAQTYTVYSFTKMVTLVNYWVFSQAIFAKMLTRKFSFQPQSEICATNGDDLFSSIFCISFFYENA
jgi:hypothetical protein